MLAAKCKTCQRDTDPSQNRIVFCDSCSTAYHQYCHSPPISNEVVTVLEKEWLCGPCARSKENVVQGTENLVAAESLSIDEVFRTVLVHRKGTDSLTETRILVYLGTTTARLAPFARHHSTPRASHFPSQCYGPHPSRVDHGLLPTTARARHHHYHHHRRHHTDRRVHSNTLCTNTKRFRILV